MTDFEMTSSTPNLTHRTYLYYNTNTSNRQYWWGPRIDMLDGNEPSVAALLNLDAS